MILESELFDDDKDELEIIKNMKKVKCKVLQEGYRQTLMAFFICSCDPQQKKPICEECAVVCHSGHTLSEKYYSEQVCSCGKKNHKVGMTPKERNPYDPTCRFMEVSKISKLNIFYSTEDGLNSCVFCKNFCFSNVMESDWRKVVADPLPDCACRGHKNSKVIYRGMNEMEKFTKIESLTPTHWLNLIFLTKPVFENNYVCFQHFNEKFSKKLGPNYEFDPNIALSNHYLSLSNFALYSNNCYMQNYFPNSLRELFKVELIYKLVELPFNEDCTPVWIFKNNYICCFEKIVFEADLVGLPAFRIQDYSNFTPAQRILFNSNLKIFPQIFEKYINSQKNLIDVFMTGVMNIITSKNFKIVGYDIIFRLIHMIKEFSKFNLISTEQLLKYFDLIDQILLFFDEIINKSDPKSTTFKEVKTKEVLVLECICKTLLYSAMKFNDNSIEKLIQNNLEFENFKFFHQKNEMAKGLTRNCINILNYTKICSTKKFDQNEDLSELHLHLKDSFISKTSIFNDRFEQKYRESIKNVLILSTQIIGLCLNSPDMYIVGMKRLLAPNNDLAFYASMIRNELQSKEKKFLDFVNNKFFDLEKDIHNYFNFVSSINELVNNTILNINSIFKSNDIDFKAPELNLKFEFGEKQLTKEEKLQKMRSKVNKNHQNFKYLLNKTSYINSVMKVLAIFNKFKFSSMEEKMIMEQNLLDAVLKLLFFYVEDNPDNCVVILSKDILNDLLNTSVNSINRFLFFLYTCLKWISAHEIEIDSVTLWEKFASKLFERVVIKEDHTRCLYLVLKIFKSLVLDISSLTHSLTVRKIRKSLLEILRLTKYIQNYFHSLIDEENIHQDDAKQSKIFYSFIRLLNTVYDDNCLYDSSFLEEYFSQDQIKRALRSHRLNLKIRTELIKYFRLVFMDVSLDLKRIPNYIAEFSSHLQINSQILNLDELKNFIFLEKLLNVSGASTFDNFGYEVLIYELKNFRQILENSSLKSLEAKINYIEIGLITSLRVFFTKIFCMAHKLSGRDFIKVYELIILFLYMKQYLLMNQSLQNKSSEKKKGGLLKALPEVRINENVINWRKVSGKELGELENDIKKMSDPSFQALDFVACYEIVNRQFFEFIHKQKSQNLGSYFDEKVEEIGNEEIEEIMKHMESDLEKNLLRIIVKYENLKRNFDDSSLVENLDDMHVVYQRNYRNLLLQYLFFLSQNVEVTEEYFSKNANYLILKLLMYDTGNVQREIHNLILAEELKLEVYIEMFFKQVMSVIFTNYNPSTIDFHHDYKTSCTIIKIFKFLCEEHNKEFQEIFLSQLEISLPSKKKDIQFSGRKPRIKDDGSSTELSILNDDSSTKKKGKKIRFFDFVVLILDKIILMSNWVKSNNEEDENINYFYDLYSCIIELLIETIQGTEKKNFDIFLSKYKTNHIIEHEYVIEKESLEEVYIHSLSYFLVRAREIIYSEVTQSDTMYNVKTALMKLLLAFLEEKKCHIEIKNLIIQTYFPKNIMYPILSTLKNYYLNKMKNKDPKQNFVYEVLNKADENNGSENNVKFNRKVYNRLFEDYCKGDLSKSLEFNYANTMYRYIKLLAVEFENPEAMSIIQLSKNENISTSVETEEEEFYYVKKLFEKITKLIWVKLDSDESTRVIFTVDPLIFYLSENTKRDFIQNVPRENRYAKLISLLLSKDLFYDEILYNYDNLRESKVQKFVSDFDFYWTGGFAFFYCLAINIYMISVLNNENVSDTDKFEHKQSLLGLHLGMVLLTSVFIFMWFYGKYSVYHRKDRKIYLSKNKKLESDLTWLSTIYITVFHTIFGRGEIVQMFWITIWGIFGLINVPYYFCYSIALLSVVGLSETLKNIVLAVYLKWKQLLSTLMFVLFVVYIYANIAYFYLREDMVRNGENNCESLRMCYMYFVIEGLRAHGGIGDRMARIAFSKFPGHHLGRVTFDLTFFLLIVVVLLNIVFGIIIDTFRELRVHQQRTEKDKSTVCFICGANKDELERDNINYEQHTEEEHNIWNYVYYMIGLELVDVHDMNAINSEVFEKIKNNEISWIPSSDQKSDENEEGHE